MRHQINHSPSYSLLEITLASGEKMVSDAGAMAWMDPDIKVKTNTRGGVFRGLKRALLAGESFFQNTYTADRDGSQIHLAPGPAGDIRHLAMSGEELFLQKGAYLASSEGVTIDSKFGGLKGFFNEGLFILRATGHGDLFFNSYGDIQMIEVSGEYVIDNGYAVAWESTLDYRLTKAGKIRSFLFSDQIVLRFSGHGRVWVQSRSPHSFASWIYPYRRKKSSSN